jgi:Transposase DDE domain
VPTTLAELADALQAVFTTEADDAARAARLIRHTRKFTGATFVQTLVFGWLHQPEASLEDLCATAADLGVDVAPQSLDERLNACAADCLRRVLAAALNRLVAAGPADAALLGRFAGVYALDATSWALPAALAALFPGTGAGDRAAGTNQAALKVLLRLEVSTGALDALEVRPGRGNDVSAPLAWAPLPEGALLLDDLGFFDLDRLQHYAAQGVYFLSRLAANTHVGHGGRCGHLAELLRRQTGDRVDLTVEVGAQARLPCRLLAVRVPEAVAEERRRRVRRSAQRHGRRLRAERLELCGWNVLITNAPPERIGLDEAWSLRRLRWQIELLFKVWKSEGRLDETRGRRVWRVVCEAYAKLLGQVVQHWVSLVGGGSPLASSPRRAARVVRSAAVRLARALREAARLVARLEGVGRVLRRLCKVRRRRGRPCALQLVQDPALDPLAHGELAVS